MKKITDNAFYKGIIITSSGILDWLVKKANTYKCKDKLLQMQIVSWHENINNKIKAYK